LSNYKRYLIIASTLLLANLLVTPAYAQEYKIGVVNAQRILEQSPQARKTEALLENEFSPRQKQLLAEQKALQDLEAKHAKDAAVMGETERKNLERDIVTKQRDLQRNNDVLREDFAFRRNEELAKIQTEIVNAIQVVAKDNKFDLVLSDGVIFASSAVDMTDLVIQYLSKQAAAN
jgi:outer membrane protein